MCHNFAARKTEAQRICIFFCKFCSEFHSYLVQRHITSSPWVQGTYVKVLSWYTFAEDWENEKNVGDLQEELDIPYEWAEENNMKFNGKKFQVVKYGKDENLKDETSLNGMKLCEIMWCDDVWRCHLHGPDWKSGKESEAKNRVGFENFLKQENITDENSLQNTRSANYFPTCQNNFLTCLINFPT